MKTLLKILNEKSYKVKSISKDKQFIFITFTAGRHICTVAHIKYGKYKLAFDALGADIFSEEFAEKVYNDIRYNLRKERKNEK